MLRVGLLLYLMLVTASGPFVCCCLAVEVGDAIAQERRESSGCCSQHAPSNKEIPSKCPKPPCPCKEASYDPNAGRTSDSAEILNDLRQQVSVGTFALVATGASVDVAAETGIPPNLAFTFLDSRDILRAIHGLRC